MLDSWIKFVRAHIEMALGLGLLIVVFVLFNRYENNRHDEAVTAAAATKGALDDQVKKNEILAGQVASASQAYSQLSAQMAQANASLKAEIATLSQKLAEQQQADASMSLADLSDRWSALIGSAPGEISAIDNDTVSVSGQASHKTVSQLEMVEPLHKEVLDGHAIEENLNKQITGLNGVNTAQASQITGLNLQLQKSDENCKAQLKIVKPTFFGKIKAALKSFGVGIGVGVLLAHKL